MHEGRRMRAEMKRRYGDRLVSLLQFGSSLRPSEMFPDSDFDFIAVVRRAKRDFSLVSWLGEAGCEADMHIFSPSAVSHDLAAGQPVPLMAVNFGRVLYDNGFIAGLGRDWHGTGLTYERWLFTGWRVFERAVFDYFGGDSCCYLKDCHHACRSFLRAYILKKKGVLCESDSDIIANTPYAKLTDIYRKLMVWRRNRSYEPEPVPKIRWVAGKNAKPLLAAERLVRSVYAELEGAQLYTLNQTLRRIPESCDHISIVGINVPERKYSVSVVGKNRKMKFLEFPLFAENARQLYGKTS